VSRYWRVRDCALEEAACFCERAARVASRESQELATPEFRIIALHRKQEAERLMWVIRNLKVESCGHDHLDGGDSWLTQ
jgi:hypothetical protein